MVKTTAKTAAPSKTTKKVVKKTTESSALVAEKPVEIAPLDAAATTTEEISCTSLIKDKFSVFSGLLQDLSSQLSSLRQELKLLERDTTRELRNQEKENAKRRRKTGNRKPSGFVKPTLISTELANFLGKPEGTEIARTDVTREINAYIKSNNLQDPTNGRKIIPDAKLKTLLKLKKGDELSYFNLQKYMSSHFAKANSKEFTA
jgi:chromatin remodeling complex protein RSC6